MEDDVEEDLWLGGERWRRLAAGTDVESRPKLMEIIVVPAEEEKIIGYLYVCPNKRMHMDKSFRYGMTI